MTAVDPTILEESFVSITKSIEELSIVVSEGAEPKGAELDAGWRALMIEGPLDFSLVGVLASISSVLARGGVSIFAISTFNTDFILVKETDLRKATNLLMEAGHQVD